MELINIFENNKYTNCKYICSGCGGISYDSETATYSPQIIKAVESFMYYDKHGDVCRTQLYVCPHCGILQTEDNLD